MAPLITSALSHTAHPAGLRSHIVVGPNSDHLAWRLSSRQKSRRRCKIISIRSRPERISSEVRHEHLRPSEIPRRDWFHNKFVFGAATSAYQVLGMKGGKGPSTWDHFCHNHPEMIDDWSNGDVAVNSYHLYEEDVRMLKEMGMDAYRFSISWSRILPKGTLEGGKNYQGIQYYENLINLLKDNGIEPYVTIFHWDVPQALEDKYDGFLSPRIVKDYKDFANVCFENFGDKVKNWFTFNEPHIFCTYAYGTGVHAPGRCSRGLKCAIPCGDSLNQPYLVGHHILQAHAEVANLYKKTYKAQQRSMDFHLGWFMEPLFRGDYPFSMRSQVGHRLPYFRDDEKEKLVHSYDMIGLNYYTSRFAEHINLSQGSSPVVNTDDACARLTMDGYDGNPIGPDTGIGWIKSYPKGLKELLIIIKDRYGNPPIYITENGTAEYDDGNLSKGDALNDYIRLDYLQRHISVIKESIDLGADVHGHFTWSLLDNFEWANGYTSRFGLIYVDRDNGFKRSMKKSAKWFREFNSAPRKVFDDYDIVLEPPLVIDNKFVGTRGL